MQFNSVSSENSSKDQTNQNDMGGNMESTAKQFNRSISIEHFVSSGTKSSNSTNVNLSASISENINGDNMDVANRELLELANRTEKATLEMVPIMLFATEENRERSVDESSANHRDLAEPHKDDRMAAPAKGLPSQTDLRDGNAEANRAIGNGDATVTASQDEANSKASSETTNPQCGRNTQSGKENVESLVGTETGHPKALSIDNSGETSLAGALSAMVEDQSEGGIKFWNIMQSMISARSVGFGT